MSKNKHDENCRLSFVDILFSEIALAVADLTQIVSEIKSANREVDPAMNLSLQKRLFVGHMMRKFDEYDANWTGDISFAGIIMA